MRCVAMIRDEPVLMEVLGGIADLPEGLLVAGALYNLAWNRLTGRPGLAEVADIDVFYFDPADLSYEAEDVVIRRLDARFGHLPLPVQVRNQARVHLWFEQKFGAPFTPLVVGRRDARPLRLEGPCGRCAHGRRRDSTSSRPSASTISSRSAWCPTTLSRTGPRMRRRPPALKAVWPQLTVVPW